MSRTATGRAFARAGLLGNPSDIYGGKAIAFAFSDFSAQVELRSADCLRLVPGREDCLEAQDLRRLVEDVERAGVYGGLRLLKATLVRFFRAHELAEARFELRYRSDIPRQVGLAGSSAIVVATLRALCEWFGAPFVPLEMARLALAVETQDLGITAGPMDRVIQASGGLRRMDFREPWTCEPLDPGSLPPLFIAWDPCPGQVSGAAHSQVRERWLRGDPAVRELVGRFPALVDEGVRCLQSGARDRFRELMDRNFDLRASLWPLRERDVEMVQVGRREGAAVKFCGSGGAVVGALADPADYPRLVQAYRQAGFSILAPRIAP